VADDTDPVIEGASPEEIERRLAEWSRGLEQKAERYRAMRAATDTVRVTESTSDGAVSVTVDATGQLVDVTTSSAVGRRKPEQIGPLVMACVRRAQSRLADQVGEAMRHSLGTDPVTERIVEGYRHRFPEQVEEPGGGTQAYLKAYDVEEEDAPRSRPPARPPLRPADDEDDFGGESVLRQL
jgi:DNA-binding protein YbaB